MHLNINPVANVVAIALAVVLVVSSTDRLVGGRTAVTGPVDAEVVQPSPRAAEAARVWADRLTNGWRHIIDPISFDEFAMEYCVRYRLALREAPGPYADLAAIGRVDTWAKEAVAHSSRTDPDRRTTNALVTALGYGCAGAGGRRPDR